MRALVWWLGCVVVAGSMVPGSASAHESRPLYVEVEEKAPLVFSVRWKVPPTIDARNVPTVSMTGGCTLATGEAMAAAGGAFLRTFHCRTEPAGTVLRVDYPLFNPSVSSLVRVTRLSGERQTLLGSPDQAEMIFPATESFGQVARDYLALGVRHILEGYDHLLFLVCLLFIAGTWRRILVTVTGFTLAHSITLALSALGVVRVSVPPVEAAIALSIVFLAVEIVRGDEQSLAYRYPVAVASSFGLLHGLGFAAVLRDTGLPQTEVPAALLFFNVGVEVGQILFVIAVIILYQLARAVARTIGHREWSVEAWGFLRTPAAYGVGILASFWMIQRVATFWTS